MAQPGMQTIAEGEIDDAITATERHCRLGAFCSERMKPGSDSARQYDANRPIMHEPFDPVPGKSRVAWARTSVPAGQRSNTYPNMPDVS